MTDSTNMTGLAEPRSTFVKLIITITVAANLFFIGLGVRSLHQSRRQYE